LASDATYGDYYFSPGGFALTLLGVLLAIYKVRRPPSSSTGKPANLSPCSPTQIIATNRILTGTLALSPLEALHRLSQLAFAQALLGAYLTGELAAATATATGGLPSSHAGPLPFLELAGNGLLGFLLNVSSFATNRAAGALTMTVCANVKQRLTVLLGIMLFRVRVGALKGVSMGVALAGAAWYSVVKLRGRRPRGREAAGGVGVTEKVSRGRLPELRVSRWVEGGINGVG